MEELDKMQNWLRRYPGWEDSLWVDFLNPAPGYSGLFPQGMEIRSRQVDVLGNQQVSCRYRFVLYRQVPGQEDCAADAQWLLDFQDWVLRQSAAGLAPRFGDFPEQEHMQAQKGALQQSGQTKVYAVTLIADFVRQYPAA